MPANITTIYDEDDNAIELPTKWVICGTCEGNGAHSLRMGAMTQADIDEMGPDTFDDYMAGYYDAMCDDCEGSGKIKVADRSAMTEAQRKMWEDQTRAEEAYQAEVRAEQRYFHGLDAY